MDVQHQQWKEGTNGIMGRKAEGRVVETYVLLSRRSVPDKVVGEDSAMNTGLLDRMRWEDIPKDFFFLYIRQLGITTGRLFWFFDFCGISFHNAHRRKLEPSLTDMAFHGLLLQAH